MREWIKGVAVTIGWIFAGAVIILPLFYAGMMYERLSF